MSANFPGNPQVGNTVTIENIKRRWTGTTWAVDSSTVRGGIVQSNNGTIDLSKGNYHKIAINSGNASVTVNFTNVSPGSSKWFLELDTEVAYTITWPASVIWTADTPPETTADRLLILEFYTPDGGTTVYGIKSMNASGFALGTWDLSYAAADNSFVASYGNIHDAEFLQSFSVSAQDTNPAAVFFRSDGLKVYILGANGDDVNEYNLSTAWNISTMSFVRNFSIAGQETTPRGISFKPDGTKMYVVGTVSDSVHEYDLSTAWNISTTVYLQSFSLAAQDTAPQGLFFKPDGTKMYTVSTVGDLVREYDLSTPWNISTIVYLRSFDVGPQIATPNGLCFSDDGLKMYVVNTYITNIYQYNLSTAWNISTASYISQVYGDVDTPSGVFVKPDGTKMYTIGSYTTGERLREYNLGTTGGFFIGIEENLPTGLFFKPDGTKMYIVGSTGDDVNEYNLSTAWDISTAVYLQNFSLAAQETAPNGVFFKPDGTKMYIVGSTGDDVNEYNLSTAWNISTASFVQIFSVAGQETGPSGVFFKPDGTKMYIIGITGDDVNEYNLSTAWNISTASFVQIFSVASQEINPRGVFFKPDGTKMYVVGTSGDDVNEYNLSTAWNISTASFVRNYALAGRGAGPVDIFFKPDGSKMYILGSGTNTVYVHNVAA